MQTEIAGLIAEQQRMFYNGTGDDNPENLEVFDIAYVDAEPNCWLVYAKWHLKR